MNLKTKYKVTQRIHPKASRRIQNMSAIIKNIKKHSVSKKRQINKRQKTQLKKRKKANKFSSKKCSLVKENLSYKV